MNNLFFYLHYLSKLYLVIWRTFFELLLFNLSCFIVALQHLERVLVFYFLTDIKPTNLWNLRIVQVILHSRISQPRISQSGISQSALQQGSVPFYHTLLIYLLFGICQLKIIKITFNLSNLTSLDFWYWFWTMFIICLLWVFIFFIILIKNQYLILIHIFYFSPFRWLNNPIQALFLSALMLQRVFKVSHKTIFINRLLVKICWNISIVETYIFWQHFIITGVILSLYGRLLLLTFRRVIFLKTYFIAW